MLGDVVDQTGANAARRKVLEYFSTATQIGMTATPKQTKDVSNIDYFGEPIYTYSLRQGISDGFLAPYKVVRIGLDRNLDGWRPDSGQTDEFCHAIEDREYNDSDYDPERLAIGQPTVARLMESSAAEICQPSVAQRVQQVAASRRRKSAAACGTFADTRPAGTRNCAATCCTIFPYRPFPMALSWTNVANLYGPSNTSANGAIDASPGQRPGSEFRSKQALKGRPKPCRSPSPVFMFTLSSAPRTESASSPMSFASRCTATWPPC